MKRTIFLALNLALCLSLMGLSGSAHAQRRAKARNPRLVVSFYSICCGIDHEARERLDKFIGQYEKTKRRQLAKSTVNWGREGEIDYCLPLSEISAREQRSFISKVRSLLKSSKLVHIEENVACRNE
jgi:hypothetical protein